MDDLVIVDVGASIGLATQHVANAPGVRLVVAIEPNEESATQIPTSSNVVVETVAIANVDQPTTTTLWVPKNPELGSLFKWHDATSLGNAWGQRADIGPALLPRSTRLTSLEHIMILHGLDHVDFIKIDCQGMDIEVLESARSLIGSIAMGVMEVAINPSVAIYDGAGRDTLEHALGILNQLGMEPYRVTPNDTMQKEYNLFFRRRGTSTQLTEKRMRLFEIPLFFSVSGRQALIDLRTALRAKVRRRRRVMSGKVGSDVVS